MAIIYKDGKPVVVSGGEPGGEGAGQEPSHEPASVQDVEMSRRRFMRGAFLGTMGAFLTGAGGTFLLFFWPKEVGTFGSTVRVGSVDEFPPGSVTPIRDGRFYIVHTLPEDGGGFLALYWKCVHLGCTVPWLPAEDGSYGGKTYKGIFRCPCHGSQYVITGQNFAGPAPRPLDIMEVQISGGTISVNTGSIKQREQAQPSQQVKA